MEAEFDEGVTLYKMGKHEDALKILTKVYVERISCLGTYHSDTSAAEFQISLVFCQQCKYEAALYHAKEALRKRVVVFGKNHKRTAIVQLGIASILAKKGQYAEARKAYEEVYEFEKNYFGSTHEYTLDTWSNMTWVREMLGEDVLPIFQEIYYLQKEANPNKRATLETGFHIANQLTIEGKLNQALAILKEINAIQDRVRPRHPDTRRMLVLTAKVHQRLDQYNEALQIWNKIYETEVEIFVPGDLHKLFALRNIGISLINLNRFEEAVDIFIKLNSKEKALLGATHTETINTKKIIAKLQIFLHKFDEALSTLNEIYEIERSHPDKPDTLPTRILIAKILREHGGCGDALKIYKEITESQKNLSPTHTDVLKTRIEIAKMLVSQNEYDKALKMFTEIEEIWVKSNFDTELLEILEIRYSIAVIKYKQYKLEEALEIFTNILKIRRESISISTADELTSNTLIYMATIYSQQGKLVEALSYYELVYATEVLTRGPDHPALLQIQFSTALILARQRNYPKALEMFQELCVKQVSVLGKLHIYTLRTKKHIQQLESIISGLVSKF